ncbi:MAG: hypothetical protein NXI04_26540, partial [Planctomycetaceae bacterium]|nr:hypothetical protein [Planctomycetaceae bacterium]
LVVERLVVERLVVERLVVERLVVERLVVERLVVERLVVERLVVERSNESDGPRDASKPDSFRRKTNFSIRQQIRPLDHAAVATFRHPLVFSANI